MSSDKQSKDLPIERGVFSNPHALKASRNVDQSLRGHGIFIHAQTSFSTNLIIASFKTRNGGNDCKVLARSSFRRFEDIRERMGSRCKIRQRVLGRNDPSKRCDHSSDDFLGAKNFVNE